MISSVANNESSPDLTRPLAPKLRIAMSTRRWRPLHHVVRPRVAPFPKSQALNKNSTFAYLERRYHTWRMSHIDQRNKKQKPKKQKKKQPPTKQHRDTKKREPY